MVAHRQGSEHQGGMSGREDWSQLEFVERLDWQALCFRL
jgi:hypothetical protein